MFNKRLYIERPELSRMSCAGCAFIGKDRHAPDESEPEIYKLCTGAGDCSNQTIWIEVP